jgi:hypothetical protein
MKITKSKLKQIIKEEASYVLSENSERIKEIYKHWEEYELKPLLNDLDSGQLRKSVTAAKISNTAGNVFQKLIDAVARDHGDTEPLLAYRAAADNAAALKDQGKDIGSEFAINPVTNIRNALGII